MSTQLKPKDIISIKQYVTDKRGHKVAAIIGIEEINRIRELLEDFSDLKTINDRKDETEEDYEVYSSKRKSRISV